MSLQTILEGDVNKGNIKAQTVDTLVLQAALLGGAGSISDGLNDTATAEGGNVLLDVVLPATLVEGDIYLVLWQCRIRSAAGNNETELEVIFDQAQQNESIGGSSQLGTTTINFMQQSGFSVLLITSAGAGTNKLVRFDLVGTAVQIGQASVAIIQINAIIA